MSVPISLQIGDGASELVYFHGRGSAETEAYAVGAAFPGARICAYRAPIPEGAGFAWFRNRGIGVADEESLATSTNQVGGWLRRDFLGKPWLCGFSNGAAMASGLILAEPDRFAGLIMIGGCLVTEGRPPGRLQAKPVLFCRGSHDAVIPPSFSRASWEYLSGAAGANAQLLTYEGGHELSPELYQPIGDWFRAHARASGGAF